MNMKNQLDELMYKDKVWSVIGFITFNKGSFLYLYNESEIINLDLFKVKGLSQYFKDDVMKSTESEIFLANYIKDKLSLLNLDFESLKNTMGNFNKLIQNGNILANLLELDSNPNKLEKNKQELIAYFDEQFDSLVDEITSDNKLSEIDNVNEVVDANENEDSESDKKNINVSKTKEDFLNETNNLESFNENENVDECEQDSVNNLENSFYGPYDEKEVTEYLKSNKNKNISEFVITYLNQFNKEQIEFILSNYNLDTKLKETLQLKNEAFDKKEIKPQNNNNKKNTIVDIMFLVFVIGLISVLYLIYLYINMKL